MTGTAFSSAELLLMTALRLTNDGFAPFSADNLIVEAWKANAVAFGMKEYIQYPDTHRAFSCLCGAKGLVGRAWLCRINGRYALTEKGRKYAAQLLGEPQEATRMAPGRIGAVGGPTPDLNGGRRLANPGIDGKPVRLSPYPYQDALMLRLLQSPCRDRDVRLLNFADAANWWGISNENPEAAEAVSDALRLIADLYIGQGVILSDRREITGHEIASLAQLDAALRARFASHLKLLSNRNGKA